MTAMFFVFGAFGGGGELDGSTARRPGGSASDVFNLDQ